MATVRSNVKEPQFYVIEVRDSDGNDCTIYDVIAQATSAEDARDKVFARFAKMYPEDEEDGGMGTYHACHCECEHGEPLGQCTESDDCDPSTWECSHGGILVDDSDDSERAYPSRAAALGTCRPFHILIDLTNGG